MNYNIYEKTIGENEQLMIIDILDIDKNFSEEIDGLILKICYGKNLLGKSISAIKKNLYKNYSKDLSTVKTGAIAEFFMHIFLSKKGFHQECKFLNLEDINGIKKGFDGVYSYNEELWISESKSGDSMSIGINHQSKINEAYRDLEDKFSSKTDNNPWENAYNHANNIDINTTDTLLSILKKCSCNFDLEISNDISKFNVIPTSTIFVVDEKSVLNNEYLKKYFDDKISKYNYKKILLVCITQKCLNLFLEYLKEW